ncbi:hypothetical protein CBM2633_A70067 [Cupriavidus taiwanensis]|nr:hypothetical protein CBM2614_A210022 [Cupriavidus taiwanensis]SPA15971.1 hypothetical protein CBM2633_A70067 [Cupriavidus taiwanensis]
MVAAGGRVEAHSRGAAACRRRVRHATIRRSGIFIILVVTLVPPQAKGKHAPLTDRPDVRGQEAAGIPG